MLQLPKKQPDQIPILAVGGPLHGQTLEVPAGTNLIAVPASGAVILATQLDPRPSSMLVYKYVHLQSKGLPPVQIMLFIGDQNQAKGELDAAKAGQQTPAPTAEKAPEPPPPADT